MNSFSITKGGVIIHVKQMVFIIVIVLMGVHDFKTKTIPNLIPILILFLGLVPYFNVLESLLGLFLLPVPFIVPIFLNYESIGGGDIKLAGALGFYFGLGRGLVAVISALILVLIMQVAGVIIHKAQNKGRKIALGPYLAAGSIISLLLF